MQDGGSDPTEQPAHPPGWYPDGSGYQRWWDWTQWTETQAPPVPMTTSSSASDPKTIAALVHASGLFLGFVGPLVGYLVYPNDPFIREHSRQALNFQLTVLIGLIISAVLFLVFIGILTFFALIIVSIILEIMGAIAASKGERFEYPLAIPFISS